MKIPTNLKHKPVIVTENYENIDGRRAYETDAKGLSLGLAQWNDRGRVDISAKVWRYTGEKWSRQSEELPLHRVLDLAILVCRSQQYFRDAYRYPKLYDEQDPSVDQVGLQGDAMRSRSAPTTPVSTRISASFRTPSAKDDEMLGERFAVLARILKEMGY